MVFSRSLPMQSAQVDVLVLSRPNEEVRESVMQAIRTQAGVHVNVHRGYGATAPGDFNRWETIARARNALKSKGNAPWVMFVDDDVRLEPNCIATLVNELASSPALGAIAADYNDERCNIAKQGHVTMGACVFRREVLESMTFRSTQQMCECGCCCLDLRQKGIGITYSRHARATHLKQEQPATQTRPTARPIVLAAFDRRDIGRFQNSFLASLRAWGNRERVVAIAYGAFPSEVACLQRLHGVTAIAKPYNGQMVPVRRVHDFYEICRRLSGDTPIAYWDVADVVFQTNLEQLWQQVRSKQDRIIAVSEPKGYPYNKVIPAWSLSIRNRQHRMRAFRLLQHNPFLNSGFAAGTANAIGQYFQAATGYLRGPELSGTTDWGDQMCLNLYCHTHPERWHEPSSGWNYCVHDRPLGEVFVTPQGLGCSRSRGPIPIVHGNARSLRQFSHIV